MLTKKIKEYLDIATIEAIVTYGDKEGSFTLDLHKHYETYKDAKSEQQKDKVIDSYSPLFNDFNVEFDIARCYLSAERFPKERLFLIRLIFEVFLPSLEQNNTSNPIQNFSELIKKNGLSAESSKGNHKRTISAISKLAFLYNPMIYLPYDKNVRESVKDYLKENRIRMNINNDYLVFLEVLGELEILIKQMIPENYLNDKMYLENLSRQYTVDHDRINTRINCVEKICRSMNIENANELVLKRCVDKILMMCGGFKKDELEVFVQEYLH